MLTPADDADAHHHDDNTGGGAAILAYEQREGGGRRVRVVPRRLPVISIVLSIAGFPAAVATTEICRNRLSVSDKVADGAGLILFAAFAGLGCGLGAAMWFRLRRPSTPMERRALRQARIGTVIGALSVFYALLFILHDLAA